MSEPDMPSLVKPESTLESQYPHSRRTQTCPPPEHPHDPPTWSLSFTSKSFQAPKDGNAPFHPIMTLFLVTFYLYFPISIIFWHHIQSVQLLSRVWLFAIPWTAARQASLSITNSRSSLKLMSIGSVMPSNHLILCRPLLLPPSIFPSIRVFSDESVLPIRWPKYWSFSLNISPSNEYSELISLRMDWLDLLAVQGTLKSLLQHHTSKASIIWCSVFFIVQLSHPYMTTGKTMTLTRQTFAGS